MTKRFLYSIAQRHFTGSLQYVSKDELYKALDEYVATEKKVWLDKVCEWVNNNGDYYIGRSSQGELVFDSQMIDDLRKVIEE